MTKCRKCKEIIGPSAPSYRASRGFIDEDGNFHDDESVVFHTECYYAFNPFEAIEESITNN